NHIRLCNYPFDACESVLRQSCIGVKKEENVASRRLSTMIHLARALLHGGRYHTRAMPQGDVDAAIGTARVDSNDFMGAFVLLDRSESRRQVAGFVKDRNDDGDHRQSFRPIIQTSASRFLSLLVGTGPPGGPPLNAYFCTRVSKRILRTILAFSGSGTEKVMRHPTGYEQTNLKRRNSYV